MTERKNSAVLPIWEELAALRQGAIDVNAPVGTIHCLGEAMSALERIPDTGIPTLADLRGIAPNATDDESSEDFVRRLRDEWRDPN